MVISWFVMVAVLLWARTIVAAYMTENKDYQIAPV